jgi:acetyltransferase
MTLFAMFRSLSDETIRRRFLRSQKNLTKSDAEETLRLDNPNVTSLMAILLKDHSEQAIGEARYVTDQAARLAEAAVVVADEWRNRGLGTALFSDLIAEAKRQGLTRIFAYFDVENKSMMRVGQRIGFKLTPKETGTDYSMMKAEIVL